MTAINHNFRLPLFFGVQPPFWTFAAPNHTHSSRSKLLRCAVNAKSSPKDIKVSQPSTPTLTPSLPHVKPISWAFAAALLTISVAALSLSRNIFRASKKLSSTDIASDARAPPLSSAEESAVASVSSLLLAAETAAQVDETVHLSDEDLDELDFNVRTLITNMDAQLMELQDELAAFLPSIATDALNAAYENIAKTEEKLGMVDQGSEAAEHLEKKLTDLQWEVFGVIQPHASDDKKRNYRSLLYNRSVQAQLLRQVERQTALRLRMKNVEDQLKALENNKESSSPSLLNFAVAGCAIPHPKKVENGGEDAFFANSKISAVGIGDGVGGWSQFGIDPSEYPTKLMVACETNLAQHRNPYHALVQAHSEVHAPGSCTVILACLDGTVLRIASLGDCGTRILRNGKVIFASEVQEHKFNQPYQLGSPRHHPGNEPSDAHQYNIEVQPGDVIVLGSDGLWDNLWDHELEDMIAEELGLIAADQINLEGSSGGDSSINQKRMQELADRLAALAAAHARDAGYNSPFAQEKLQKLVPEGMRQFVSSAQGGKLDDVTAAVGIIY